MELRERIAEALHDHDHMHTWGSKYCDDACGIAAFIRADLVLAVLDSGDASGFSVTGSETAIR